LRSGLLAAHRSERAWWSVIVGPHFLRKRLSKVAMAWPLPHRGRVVTAHAPVWWGGTCDVCEKVSSVRCRAQQCVCDVSVWPVWWASPGSRLGSHMHIGSRRRADVCTIRSRVADARARESNSVSLQYTVLRIADSRTVYDSSQGPDSGHASSYNARTPN
jgi:hypothetical protein